MGLFSAAFDRRSYGPDHDFWYGSVYGGATLSGAPVNPETAYNVSVVYACVKILSETLASVPCFVYRRLENGGKERATDHPLYPLLHDRPNGLHSSFDFMQYMESGVALRGNSYAYIQQDSFGKIMGLLPLPVDRVTTEVLSAGRLRYRYRDLSGEEKVFLQEEILHDRGLSRDGYVGLSVLTIAREAIGLALAAQGYGASFFKNDATPGGVLIHPSKLTQESYDRLKQSWKAAHGGFGKARQIGVLEEGLKYEPLSATNEDAQWIETRGFEGKDICRFFRVPPHKAGILDDATFSNIEHQAIEFLTDTMLPQAVRFEKRARISLLPSEDDRDYFIEFNLDALLRGDFKTRAEGYSSAISAGWMNRNEVRVKENLNPEPGLDKFLEPLNMDQANGRRPDGGSGRKKDARALAIARSAAARVIRKECQAIRKEVQRLRAASDDAGRNRPDQKPLSETMAEFYTAHAEFVSDVMALPAQESERFCRERHRLLAASADPVQLAEIWEAAGPPSAWLPQGE